VTGGDVVVDAAHPAATPTVVGNEHDIPTGTDNRDVTENHLTVDGVSVGGSYVYNGRAYGGLTQADAGNATKNTVMVKNNARVNGAVYGGWSKNGDATYNTVILNKTGLSSSYWNTYMSVFGGGGSGTNPSADLKTGNTLRIISSGNSAATVDNFEKMEFVLDSTLNSGDTMFSAITTSGLNLEWSDISVKGAADWIAGTDGSKEVTLYSGPAIAIKNYDMANSRTTAGDFEYGLRTNVAGTGNISATQIYFNSNKFQNGDVVLDTLHPPVGVIAYGGTSTLGNTTNHNRLRIDAVQLGGSYSYNGRAYGGYTQSETGDSKYNERRAECEKAVEELNKNLSIATLGELDEWSFDEYSYLIEDENRLKRARHAVLENQRTLQARAALQAGDLDKFGRLMNASHVSLEHDYEVTGLELDTLVHTAWEQEGVLGARMTGAGFGGCAIALVRKDAVDAFKENVDHKYQEVVGYAPSFYIAEVAGGSCLLD